MLSLAAETRKAYYAALAAEEAVRYMRQVKQAAEASAELARRMEQVGNFSKLAQMREQSFYSDAVTNLTKAQAGQALIMSGAISGEDEMRRVATDPNSGYAHLGVNTAPRGEPDDGDPQA